MRVFPVFNTKPCKGKIFYKKCMENLNYLMNLEELLNPDLYLVLSNKLVFNKSKKRC